MSATLNSQADITEAELAELLDCLASPHGVIPRGRIAALVERRDDRLVRHAVVCARPVDAFGDYTPPSRRLVIRVAGLGEARTNAAIDRMLARGVLIERDGGIAG